MGGAAAPSCAFVDLLLNVIVQPLHAKVFVLLGLYWAQENGQLSKAFSSEQR